MAGRISQSEKFAERTGLFLQAEDGIRDHCVTGVQTCALPISLDDGFKRLDIQRDGRELIVESAVSPAPGRVWALARSAGDTGLSLYEWSQQGLSTVEMPARAGSFPFRRMWQTASGHIWLTTAQGLHRKTNSTWENVQPINNSWYGVRCLAENRAGRGAVQVSNPRNLTALYTWEPDGILRHDSMSEGGPLVLMDINDAGDLIGIRESGEL